jgi:hypothetical protein
LESTLFTTTLHTHLPLHNGGHLYSHVENRYMTACTFSLRREWCGPIQLVKLRYILLKYLYQARKWAITYIICISGIYFSHVSTFYNWILELLWYLSYYIYCFGVVILSQYSSEHGVSLVLYFMCPFVYCCIHNFHVKRCSCWRSKWPPWHMRSLPTLTCKRVFMVWVFFFVLAKGHVSFSHHLSSVVCCKSFTFKSLKSLHQIVPILAEMHLNWSPFKIVYDISALI